MEDNEIKDDKQTIADLIIKNQLLEHEVIVLAELAIGASKVLDYYASSRLGLPTFTLSEHPYGEQPIFTKNKYRVVEVNSPGPDKEALLGMEMYGLKMDVDTARIASKQIMDKIKELGIIVDDQTVESLDKQEELESNINE